MAWARVHEDAWLTRRPGLQMHVNKGLVSAKVCRGGGGEGGGEGGGGDGGGDGGDVAPTILVMHSRTNTKT